MAFSPDGRTLAVGSFDGTVSLWNLTDRTQPFRLVSRINVLGLLNTSMGVWSVAFSPDGRTLAVGSHDAILWDLTDPAQPRRIDPPLTDNRRLPSVAFSPDGSILATGSLDGTVILWDLTKFNHVRDHVVERACSATRGGLDRAEWARYIPGLPYQDTCPA